MTISRAARQWAGDHEYSAFAIELADDRRMTLRCARIHQPVIPLDAETNVGGVMCAHAYLSSQCRATELPQVNLPSLLDADFARSGCTTRSPVELTCSDVLNAAPEGVQTRATLPGEYEVEHHGRNALVRAIYGGTSETQREIIGTASPSTVVRYSIERPAHAA